MPIVHCRTYHMHTMRPSDDSSLIPAPLAKQIGLFSPVLQIQVLRNYHNFLPQPPVPASQPADSIPQHPALPKSSETPPRIDDRDGFWPLCTEVSVIAITSSNFFRRKNEKNGVRPRGKKTGSDHVFAEKPAKTWSDPVFLLIVV